MKFAFSTIACPRWDLETVAARAKEYGYDGIELRGFLNESVLTAANVFLTDSVKVRDVFAQQGIAIACLSSSIAMTGRKKRDAELAGELRSYMDKAQEIGASLVRLSDMQVPVGQDRGSAAARLAQWLLPLGDYAAQRGLTLVVENLLSFRTAKEMWMMLETASHPAIACCWDIFNAALAGESPWVSVPVLNSRIQYAQVKDAKFGSLGATFCPLGQGDVPVETFLKRLRGIGYDGWVTLEWEKAWLPNIAEPEDVLPDGVKKLRQWTQPQVAEEPAKAVAK
jgi:sugar phosphate isomerase/epimerase